MPSPRVLNWTLRTQTLDLSQRPLVMGILNVTPDSFSDGGQFLEVDRAVEQALAMQTAGADLIDLGGESTRPYAAAMSVQEELDRVEPVLERLEGQLLIPLSIDTSKAAVARRALETGAEIINDVTGLTGDPEMIPLAIEFQPGICAMHMQGTPQTMQDDPRYNDVVAEVMEYLRARREHLASAGIAGSRICLDPGIGFGKKHSHNLTLVREAHRFHELGCPVLVGHSRKGFIAKELGDPDRDRMAGTLGVSLALARSGIQVLRVHDVQATVDAVRLFQITGGLGGTQWEVGEEEA